MPGYGCAGDKVLGAGDLEAKISDATGRRAGALDERATHAQVSHPLVAAREDAFFPLQTSVWMLTRLLALFSSMAAGASSRVPAPDGVDG